mgnify:CR=1 FL=1
MMGLGYVGKKIAVEFCKIRSVVGLDVKQARIAVLQEEVDMTLEV